MLWSIHINDLLWQILTLLAYASAFPAISVWLRFRGQTLPLQEQVKVLGVTVNCCLHFDRHDGAVVHQDSLHVSNLHWMAGSLDSWSILTLYKAQI
ncbi:hypothetical protein E2C01_080329 [Portunus trituberculatus]|uniref:Uncharacterized protein n=1 Tax=Portunus trituberculatus TaxID=210409 RepID=A0A5B7IY44_PORTR|nr:hypothetical protein [Portunus trituberculatus]